MSIWMIFYKIFNKVNIFCGLDAKQVVLLLTFFFFEGFYIVINIQKAGSFLESLVLAVRKAKEA